MNSYTLTASVARQ